MAVLAAGRRGRPRRGRLGPDRRVRARPVAAGNAAWPRRAATRPRLL